MGFEGSYIQKLVWFHCNGQNSRILQTFVGIYTPQAIEAAPAPGLVIHTKTFISSSSYSLPERKRGCQRYLVT